jgi:hypothetical protein
MRLHLAARPEVWQLRFQECKDFVRLNGKLPSTTSRNQSEQSLGNFLQAYSSPSSPYFKPEIQEWRNRLTNQKPWQERFEDLKQFVEVNGRLPSGGSASDTAEKSLAQFLCLSCVPNSPSYRPEVAEWRENHSPKSSRVPWQERFEDCKEFVRTNGRLPSRFVEDETERSLCEFLRKNCKPSGSSFKQEVKDWRDAVKLELKRKKLPEPKPEPLFVPKIEYKKEWGD